MDKHKKLLLEKAGYHVGDAAEFLELSDEECAIVQLRIAVAQTVRRLREKKQMSQQELATLISSSQSRVAKIESASKGVSLDLSFRGLFAVGGQLSDLSPTTEKQKAKDRDAIKFETIPEKASRRRTKPRQSESFRVKLKGVGTTL